MMEQRVEAERPVPDLGPIQEKIVAKRFDDALADLDEVLQTEPANPDALYMSAVCRRYSRDFDAALQLIERLREIWPEHGRAHQEEGHTYRDMGRPDDALLAYARACRFNPALVASWRGQLEILRGKGLDQQAAQVAAQLQALREMPKPLLAVLDLIGQRKLLQAEDICRRFLQKIPHHVEGMRLLADIGVRLGVLDDAEFLLESALKLEPDNKRVRIDYIQALRKRQKFSAALAQARLLLDSAPDNPQFKSLFAVESMQAGDYESALSTFEDILQQLPADPVTLTSKGHALKTCGNYEEAVEAYRAAIESTPHHGEAYYSLANLKVYSFSDAEIDRMHAQERNSNLSHMDRVHLCFALGKAYEDKGEFATSFHYYEQGKSAAGRVYEGILRAPGRHRLRRTRPDLRRGPATRRIHPVGADPLFPFASRRHPGTTEHPVAFAAVAAQGKAGLVAALSCNTGGNSGRGTRSVRKSVH
jgi:tetratricopeptide (TPR) repeat protein